MTTRSLPPTQHRLPAQGRLCERRAHRHEYPSAGGCLRPWTHEHSRAPRSGHRRPSRIGRQGRVQTSPEQRHQERPRLRASGGAAVFARLSCTPPRRSEDGSMPCSIRRAARRRLALRQPRSGGTRSVGGAPCRAASGSSAGSHGHGAGGSLGGSIACSPRGSRRNTIAGAEVESGPTTLSPTGLPVGSRRPGRAARALSGRQRGPMRRRRCCRGAWRWSSGRRRRGRA